MLHFDGTYGSGVPIAISGCFFVLASNSPTILSTGPMTQLSSDLLVRILARIGAEIEQKWYCELDRRRNHGVLLVEMHLEVFLSGGPLDVR
jgi:hypothetical protein